MPPSPEAVQVPGKDEREGGGREGEQKSATGRERERAQRQ